VLKAAGETETTQENIKDWLELVEGNPAFQLLIEEEICAVIFFYLISSALCILLKFLSYFLSFRAIFSYINPDYRLLRLTTPSPINPD
jgi:hypothetical protein